MSKQLLVDHISFLYPSDVIKEHLASDSAPVILKGIIQKADTQNGNGRIYRRETLDREIKKYAALIKQGNALGELDHPESSVVSLANASHKIIDIGWDGDNVVGKIELLSTPSGNIARELIKCKVPLGISSRGMGSVRQIGETIEVGNDFELLCFDLVSIPSTPGAYLYPETQGLQESLTPVKVKFDEKYYKINELLSEILNN